jgi:hypothetical protein
MNSSSIRVPFDARLLPYLSLRLANQRHTVTVIGMIDTGSTVNVLPYNIGEQLGFDWQSCTATLELAGNLRDVEARAVLIEASIENFPSVNLAFAWAQTSEVPVILGQINFFREFEVCFYGAESYFELRPKQQRIP